MAQPKDLVEIARFEFETFDRPSVEVSRALLEEVEYWRKRFPVHSATADQDGGADPGPEPSSGELAELNRRLAELQEQAERLERDAARGRFLIESGEWLRFGVSSKDDADRSAALAVRLPFDADLSCEVCREDAVDAAIRRQTSARFKAALDAPEMGDQNLYRSDPDEWR
jgi:hypothetical protein